MRYLLSFSVLTYWAWAQKSECILVKLKRAPDLTADNALHASWEEKKLRLKVPPDWEESFVTVDDDDNDRPISECFIPQFKLITEKYTYIISLACQNLITYRNAVPYKPSPQRVQNPIGFTEELRYFIERTAEKHMKIPARRLYAEYSLAYVPLAQGAIKYEDLEVLLNQIQPEELSDDDDDSEPEEPSESPADWMDDSDEDSGVDE